MKYNCMTKWWVSEMESRRMPTVNFRYDWRLCLGRWRGNQGNPLTSALMISIQRRAVEQTQYHWPSAYSSASPRKISTGGDKFQQMVIARPRNDPLVWLRNTVYNGRAWLVLALLAQDGPKAGRPYASNTSDLAAPWFEHMLGPPMLSNYSSETDGGLTGQDVAGFHKEK